MDTSIVQWQLLRNRSITLVGGVLAVIIGCSDVCNGKDSSAVVSDAGTPAEFAMKGENWQQLKQKERSLPQFPTLGSGHFEKLNLDVVVPGAPWTRVDTAGTAPNVCVCLARSNPGLLLMLVADPVGVELNPDPQLLVKFSKAKLLKISPQAVFANEMEQTVAGIRGRTFEASMPAPDGSQYCLVWVGSRNGYCYELAVVGNPYNAKEVSDASRDFCRGLRQIDPKRVAHRAPSEVFTKYKSKAFGYDIDLTGLGWVKMRTTAAQPPAAEVCLESPNGSGLIVMAVPMPNRVPDMDILAKTVIGGTGLENNGTEIVRSTPYQFGGLQCREIETSRTFDGKKVLGRMRLIADEHCAYAVFGWSLSEYKDEAMRVRKSIDEFGVRPHMAINTTNLTPSQCVTCANALNAIGLTYYKNGDLVGSLAFFESSTKYAPHDDACVCNYLEVLGKLDRTDDALQFLEDHKSIYGSNLRLRVIKARMLAQKGNTAGARKVYGELIDDGYVDNALLTAYAEMAIASKAYDEAIDRVSKVTEKRPTLQVLRLQAGLYTLKGDHKRAVDLFEKLRLDHPDDIGVAVDLATAYEQAGQLDAAVELTQKLIESGKQDEMLFLVHSRILMRQGRTAEAKRVIERAHDLYPNNERVNEVLKIASSQLGEGENSCLKKSIEPVAIPVALQKAIDQADRKAAATGSDLDAEELLSAVGVNFQPGQPIRKTTTQRVKVYTASGVARYGILTYKINPVSERLYVNRLVVNDENGKRVAEGSVDSYFVSDNTSGEASNSRTAKIPVPGLKPGYTFEAIVTRESLAAAKDFPFQEISLFCESQARVSVVFLTGDTKALKCKGSEGVQIAKSDGLCYAIESNVAPIRYEPQQPAVETFAPIVWIGPASTTWVDEARSYLKLLEDRYVLDDVTKALAAELTRNCTTKREKLAIIAQHVQQGYTYHAIEFGRRAMIPNSAAKTLALKYGDCKDHALLTKQLLSAVDIQAHLAVVRSSGDIVADMPSLDQFDHAVVFVPADQFADVKNSMGGLIIDTTAKDTDPLLDVPSGLEDRSILVLDPKNPRLIRTPKYPAGAGRLVSKRNVTLEISPSGSVESRVSEDVTLNQYLAPGMRGFFQHFDAATRREAVQRLLSDNGPIRIRSVEPLNLQAIREPLRIHLEYSVPNSFRVTNSSSGGKALVGSLPCIWETQYALATAVDSRATPFAVAMPRVIESSLVVNLPQGYCFSDLDQFTSSGSSNFRTWSSHASEAGNTVTIEYEVRLLAGRFPANAYEQFYNESNDSLAALRAPLTLHSDAGATGTARRPASKGEVR